MIDRWAPPEDDNPTAIYARYVAGRLSVGLDTPIDVAGNLPALVAAIIEFENGGNPYPDSVMLAGVDWARGGSYA